MSADAMAGIARIGVAIPLGHTRGGSVAETDANIATVEDLIDRTVRQTLVDCGAAGARVTFTHYWDWNTMQARADVIREFQGAFGDAAPDQVWPARHAHGVWVARWGGTATSIDDEPLRLIGALVGHFFDPWTKETWRRVDGQAWQRPRIAPASEVDLQSAWLEENKVTPEQWMRQTQEDEDNRPRLW